MLKINMQFFGGGSTKGGSSGGGGGGGAKGSSKAPDSTNENKTKQQIFNESMQLDAMPAGTKILVQEFGTNEWETYTAHDPYRVAPNGTFVQVRRWSQISPGGNLSLKVTNTLDSYGVANHRWRKP